MSSLHSSHFKPFVQFIFPGRAGELGISPLQSYRLRTLPARYPASFAFATILSVDRCMAYWCPHPPSAKATRACPLSLSVHCVSLALVGAGSPTWDTGYFYFGGSFPKPCHPAPFLASSLSAIYLTTRCFRPISLCRVARLFTC